MANLYDSSVTIPKNQKLGTAIVGLISQAMAITFEVDDAGGESASNFQTERSSNAETTAIPENTTGKLTVDDIVLESIAVDKQCQVREMLRPFSPFWQGQLCEVATAEHRINLGSRARSQFS